MPTRFRLPDLAPFRSPAFTRFWIMRASSTLGFQIQATTLGWLVYEIARTAGRSIEESAFLLGLIGLAQFLPLLVMSPFGGQAADRWNRKAILQGYQLSKAATLGLLILAAFQPPERGLIMIFVVAMISGGLSAFAPAASQSLMPTLVPREHLPQAVALSSLAFSSTSVIGPAVAGYLIWAGGRAGGLEAQIAFGGGALCFLAAFLVSIDLKAPRQARLQNANAWRLILEGLGYVRRNPIVLGAMSLDLVAVLLAGATALLPVFARDILNVGPEGLGLMRSAIALGAAVTAIALAVRPFQRRVGRWMFGSVAAFGVATAAFGLSTSFPLSLAALFFVGAFDMVSVNVRASLVQLATPDALRGRVASTSFIFISASNELGEFQSGVFARLFGPIGAVVIGGIGAIACTGLWIRLFPALWRMDSFQDALAFAEEGKAAPSDPVTKSRSAQA